jgi:hypothetical protein
MDHSEVSQLLIKWFKVQPQYKGWHIFQNSSGYASEEKVRYGVPPTGGGFDYFAFGAPAKTEFYEVKTIGYPNLSKDQKGFRDKMVKIGFKCWVFKEWESWPGFYVVPAQDYRPFKKWPY